MAKIIKPPSSESYLIKATIPYQDIGSDLIDPKSPYRILNFRSDTSLMELGLAVLDAFDFDNDHLFGFYNNVKGYYNAKIGFEDPAIFDDFDNDVLGFNHGTGDKQRFNMDNYTIADLFTRKGKKWVMLFDYGDEWNFWLTMEGKKPIDPKKEYPFIEKSKHEAPEQYPDYEEEDY